VLLAAPDEDVDAAFWLGDAPDFGQRGERAGDELEDVEGGYDIEGAILVGEGLDVADVKPPFGNALTRDFYQRWRGVDPGDARPGVCR
jgi:hypothetical protein